MKNSSLHEVGLEKGLKELRLRSDKIYKSAKEWATAMKA
jgi:hypothetical protein